MSELATIETEGAVRLRSLRTWFDQILDADAAARAGLLQDARSENPSLADQLERLLARTSACRPR